MKKTTAAIRGAVAGLSFFSLIFIVTSFIQWDMNPANWSQTARSLTSIIGVAFGAIIATSTYLTKEAK